MRAFDKRPFSATILIMAFVYGLGFLLALTGCSVSGGESEVVQLRLPWLSENEYQWTDINLKTLRSVHDMRGESARFVLSPKIINQQMLGAEPRVRSFKNSGGVHVASDDFSLSLMTLYAHLEKLSDFDSKMGLELVLSKPRNVGVQVQFLENPSKLGAGAENVITNNALYSPKLDAFLFLPFKASTLPLIINAGVIGHEYFHALFQFLVGKSIEKKTSSQALFLIHTEANEVLARAFGTDVPKIADNDVPSKNDKKVESFDQERRLYHDQLLRGINEGLADVWGYLYSEDTSFVERSWPSMRDRNLGIKASGKAMAKKDFLALSRLSVHHGVENNAFVYQFGSQLARMYLAGYAAQGKISEEKRIEVGKTLIAGLKKLKDRVLDLKETDWLNPSIFIEIQAELATDTKLCQSWLEMIDSNDLNSSSLKCGEKP